jgi:hypothetical protein
MILNGGLPPLKESKIEMTLFKSRLAKLEAAKGGNGLALFIVQPCHPNEQRRIKEQGYRENRRVAEVFTGVPQASWDEPWAVDWLKSNHPEHVI